MKGQITLRPAHADDRAFVFSVFVGTRAGRFESAELAQQQLQQLLEMQFRAQQAQYQAQFPSADFNLVLCDDRQIGYFYVDRSGNPFVLIDIALLPEHIGRGVGTYLVNTLIAEAFREGKPLSAHVDKSNSQAWRLWQRLGFQLVGDNGVYLEIECHPVTLIEGAKKGE